MTTFKTLRKVKDWQEQRAELGWTVAEEIRWDDEPIFDDVTGEQVDIVNIFETHYNDEDGGYVGVLHVTIGDDYTEAEFMPFTFVGME